MDQKLILDMFIKHGILAQEEAVYYIQNKPNPRDYIQRLFNAKPQFPLVMSLRDLMQIEDRIMVKEEEPEVTDITKVEAAGEKEEKTGEQQVAPIQAAGEVDDLGGSEASADEIEGTLSPQLGGSSQISAGVDPVTPAEKSLPKEETVVQDPTPSRTGSTDGFDIKVHMGKKFKPLAAEYDAEIEIMEDITGNSTCVGELSDFKNYFNDRYDTIRKILRNSKTDLGGAVTLSRAKVMGGEVRIIGMVQDVNLTKRGHKLIVLEDPNDTILCLINANNEQLIHLDVIKDEVIGIVGKYDKRRNMLYVERVIWPEIPRFRESRKANVPLSAGFISDIHLGSKTFLSKSWNRFMDWLNGRTDDKTELHVLSGLKYLVLVGDVVDGIGNYPNQYDDLDIKDIFQQYEALSHELDRIPEHIEVIMLPGNHDAVRPAEPQPTFPDMITENFQRKVHLVGNPCYLKLSGVEVLAYHGRSIDDFVTTFDHVTYEKPLEAMKEMLNRRHLLPIYGLKTPIAPEAKDHMVIRRVPDIFVTGHVHSFGAKLYRDVIMLNSSTWQSQTDYQKMLNFVPDPAKVPVINLQTKKPYQMNFLGA